MKKRALNEVDFGYMEFAPNRSDIHPLEREEPNTPEESQLWKAIVDWANNTKQPSAASISILRDAMKDPRYKKFFRETSASYTLYRGLLVDDPELLCEWLGTDVDTLAAKPRGFRDGEWTFKPRSSWDTFVSFSRSESTAQIFSKFGAEPGDYQVILEAHTALNPDVFFDLEGVLGRVQGKWIEVDWEKESEQVAIEPVVVSRIWWRKKL